MYVSLSKCIWNEQWKHLEDRSSCAGQTGLLTRGVDNRRLLFTAEDVLNELEGFIRSEIYYVNASKTDKVIMTPMASRRLLRVFFCHVPQAKAASSRPRVARLPVPTRESHAVSLHPHFSESRVEVKEVEVSQNNALISN